MFPVQKMSTICLLYVIDKLEYVFVSVEESSPGLNKSKNIHS